MTPQQLNLRFEAQHDCAGLYFCRNFSVYPRVTSLFEARVCHIEVEGTIRRYAHHLGPTPWGDTSGGPARRGRAPP